MVYFSFCVRSCQVTARTNALHPTHAKQKNKTRVCTHRSLTAALQDRQKTHGQWTQANTAEVVSVYSCRKAEQRQSGGKNRVTEL